MYMNLTLYVMELKSKILDLSSESHTIPDQIKSVYTLFLVK